MSYVLTLQGDLQGHFRKKNGLKVILHQTARQTSPKKPKLDGIQEEVSAPACLRQRGCHFLNIRPCGTQPRRAIYPPYLPQRASRCINHAHHIDNYHHPDGIHKTQYGANTRSLCPMQASYKALKARRPWKPPMQHRCVILHCHLGRGDFASTQQPLLQSLLKNHFKTSFQGTERLERAYPCHPPPPSAQYLA